MVKLGCEPRPFRYEVNQTPYDYTVGVTNRFKGLDLIECQRIWTEVRNTVQEVVTITILKKKKCKKANWLSEEALQRPLRKEMKRKHERERYT